MQLKKGSSPLALVMHAECSACPFSRSSSLMPIMGFVQPPAFLRCGVFTSAESTKLNPTPGRRRLLALATPLQLWQRSLEIPPGHPHISIHLLEDYPSPVCVLLVVCTVIKQYCTLAPGVVLLQNGLQADCLVSMAVLKSRAGQEGVGEHFAINVLTWGPWQ